MQESVNTATASAQVRANRPEISFAGRSSVEIEHHEARACVPCKFHGTATFGCRMGDSCTFCHMDHAFAKNEVSTSLPSKDRRARYKKRLQSHGAEQLCEVKAQNEAVAAPGAEVPGPGSSARMIPPSSIGAAGAAVAPGKGGLAGQFERSSRGAFESCRSSSTRVSL